MPFSCALSISFFRSSGVPKRDETAKKFDTCAHPIFHDSTVVSPSAVLALSTSSHDFGVVLPFAVHTQNVTLDYISGGAATNITFASLSDPAFVISNNTCTTSLSSGNYNFDITFKMLLRIHLLMY